MTLLGPRRGRTDGRASVRARPASLAQGPTSGAGPRLPPPEPESEPESGLTRKLLWLKRSGRSRLRLQLLRLGQLWLRVQRRREEWCYMQLLLLRSGRRCQHGWQLIEQSGDSVR